MLFSLSTKAAFPLSWHLTELADIKFSRAYTKATLNGFIKLLFIGLLTVMIN